MASYGSLCRSGGFSKLSLALRLSRPALLCEHGVGLLGARNGANRYLSSIPPRPAEKKQKTVVTLQKHTSPNKTQEANKAKTSAANHHLRTSPMELTYTGDTKMPITTQLKIVPPQEDPPRGTWPVYRLMVCACVLHHFLLPP